MAIEGRDIRFSGHALRRMLERGISQASVMLVLAHGDAVECYPDDEPYPSRLLSGIVGSRVIHVVVADDPASRCSLVLTAYEPDPRIWDMDVMRRRKR